MAYAFDEDTSKVDLDDYINETVQPMIDGVEEYAKNGLKTKIGSGNLYIEKHQFQQESFTGSKLFSINLGWTEKLKPLGVVGFETNNTRLAVERALLIDDGNNHGRLEICIYNIDPEGGLTFAKPDVYVLWCVGNS